MVSLTPELAGLAAEAWERWGKGRHPAALNIVDCCSYALAARTGEPLLAVGDDFARTDVTAGAADTDAEALTQPRPSSPS